MKKIVVTNNKKVHAKFSDTVEVKMLENASKLKVLQEGRNIAESGGRLLQDPAFGIGSHYKSLVFYKEEGKETPDAKSVLMLDKCIDASDKSQPAIVGREPLLAGIFQNKDLDSVRKVLG